jgi:hypothetical protein
VVAHRRELSTDGTVESCTRVVFRSTNVRSQMASMRALQVTPVSASTHAAAICRSGVRTSRSASGLARTFAAMIDAAAWVSLSTTTPTADAMNASHSAFPAFVRLSTSGATATGSPKINASHAAPSAMASVRGLGLSMAHFIAAAHSRPCLSVL